MTPMPEEYRSDHALVQRVLAGSEPDWHEFIERYSGLVYSILRRYLFNDEEIRDVWVQVMDRLLQGALKGYEGRSKLSTWLVFVARSTVFDHLRSVRGRREEPQGIEELDATARLVFDRFYQDGRSYEEVRHELTGSGMLGDGESLAEVLSRIEDVLSTRVLRRIAWDLRATDAGLATGRMLEFLEAAARESVEKSGSVTPEMELYRKETEATVARVRELMQELPDQERLILELRFDEGWTARRIADELELSGQREVYTIVSRATRSLRRLLGPGSGILLLVFILVINGVMPSYEPGIGPKEVPDSIAGSSQALSPQELGE